MKSIKQLAEEWIETREYIHPIPKHVTMREIVEQTTKNFVSYLEAQGYELVKREIKCKCPQISGKMYTSRGCCVIGDRKHEGDCYMRCEQCHGVVSTYNHPNSKPPDSIQQKVCERCDLLEESHVGGGCWCVKNYHSEKPTKFTPTEPLELPSEIPTVAGSAWSIGSTNWTINQIIRYLRKLK